jgi:hypothetical protein
MLYVVQVRKLSGTLVGYLKRGAVVAKRANATPYDSPSSAARAAQSRGGNDVYYTVVPHTPKGKRARNCAGSYSKSTTRVQQTASIMTVQ